MVTDGSGSGRRRADGNPRVKARAAARPLVELSPAGGRRNRVCACVVHDGRLLLVERRKGGWTLPGGGVHRGERRRQAAVREAFEEAGVAIRPGLRGIAVTGTAGARSSCFRARLLGVGPSPEGRRIRWVDPDASPWRDDPQIRQLRDRGLLRPR